MPGLDVEKLRAQALADRDQKIEAAKRSIEDAKQEYRSALDAIAKVQRLAETATDTQGAAPQKKHSRAPRGWLIGQVRAAVAKLPDGFKTIDVVQAIRTENPGQHIDPASVASTLARLVGESVKILEPGAGRRPARFGRENNESEPGGEQPEEHKTEAA